MLPIYSQPILEEETEFPFHHTHILSRRVRKQTANAHSHFKCVSEYNILEIQVNYHACKIHIEDGTGGKHRHEVGHLVIINDKTHFRLPRAVAHFIRKGAASRVKTSYCT